MTPRPCKQCKGRIPWTTEVLRLQKPKKRFTDTGIGHARACPYCRTLHWINGQKVMNVIIEGKEVKGPVYLCNDGVTITTDPGVAATTPKKGEIKP